MEMYLRLTFSFQLVAKILVRGLEVPHVGPGALHLEADVPDGVLAALQGHGQALHLAVGAANVLLQTVGLSLERDNFHAW